MVNSKPSEPKKTGDDKEVPPPGATAVVVRHPKFCFDNTLIAFQIENTLFNVYKHQLMKSTTFADMFAIAEQSGDEQTTREGSSLDNPIVMQGVSASDFECLMTVLYARHFSTHQPEPEASLIIPAFRLANMWDFAELCTYLKPLAERVLGDVDKIVFAREFQVAEWLAPAHARLCLREERIATQEADKLGLSSLLFLSRFREEKLRNANGTVRCTDCARTTYGYGTSFSLVVTSPILTEEEQAEAKVRTWLDNGCVLPD